MRTFALALGALASSACVATQGSSNDIDSKMAQYIGLSKEQIVARLGAPKAERAYGDRTLWAWTSPSRQYLPAITTLRTTSAYPEEAPVAVLVPAGGAFPNTPGCELRFVMTVDGERAERTQWSGNRAVCRSYLRTLERRKRMEPTS